MPHRKMPPTEAEITQLVESNRRFDLGLLLVLVMIALPLAIWLLLAH